MPMTDNRDRVLALYPNTNGFGYAYFEDMTEPTDCGVAVIRPVNNDANIERMEHFIKYYKPTTLVLLKYDKKLANKGKRVRELLDRTAKLGLKHNCIVKLYTRDQVRSIFKRYRAKTKQQIAKKIGEAFESVRHRVPEPRKEWEAESYNMGLFDAISLAVTHFHMRDSSLKTIEW